MAISRLNFHDEKRLLNALEDLQALSADSNTLSLHEAAVKVAQDHKLSASETQLICSAYNNGKQLDQFFSEEDSGILGRLRPFEILDHEKVYSDAARVKSSSDVPWSEPIMELSQPTRTTVKEASAAPKTSPPRPVFPEWKREDRVLSRLATLRRLRSSVRTEVSNARNKISQALEKLASYFQRPRYSRLSVRDAAIVCVNRFGPSVGPLFRSLAVKFPEEVDGKSIKVASTVRPTDDIFSYVSQCLTCAKDLADCLKKAAELDRSIDELEKKCFLKISQRVDHVKQAEDIIDYTEEFVQRALGHPVRTRSDAVRDYLRDLENVGHEKDMREVRVKAVLAEMMTDPDDVISSYPPEKVLQAYNDIVAVSPRIADKPTILRSVLRRYLTGNMEVFEAKELAEIEKALSQTVSPRYIDIRSRMLDDDRLLE